MKKIFTAAFFLLLLSSFIYSSGTVYMLADFENTSFPPAGWSVANTSNYNFIRTSYASGYGSGLSCAMADFYDYSSGNFDLISRTFPASTSGDSLIFDHAYTCGAAENDRLDIYYSTNNGSTWTLLVSYLGGSAGPLKTANPTYDLFVPTPSQWATKRNALPVGTNKVKFTGVTAYGNNLYLDNIRVGVPYSNDAGLSSIISPKWGITPQNAAPQVSVRNYGTTTQSFSVTMVVNPGGYTNTQSVTNLAAGQVLTVNFTGCNFASVGNYTMTCYTSLASDQNVSNDTITNTLVVTTAPRNVVLEFCTGTWCQWCPCGDDEAHHLAETYPNSVILAYHGSGSDPWKNFNGNGIIGLLGFAGYPSGLVDRRLGANNGWGSMFTDSENRLAQNPGATVNITVTGSNYNVGTRELTVNATATALTTLTGQYKVNYVIKEDNLVWPQTGNSYCAGNSTAVHYDVVRNMVNNANGENVNTGTWNQNQTYPLTFTTTLDAAWIPGNCNFDIFIYKDNGSLNVSEVQQGISSSFTVTGINQQGTNIPDKYELSQNYPNPFNPVTNVHFSIPKSTHASFKVYNAVGQLMGVYLDGYVNAGQYNADIDASNFASGIYYYTLSTPDFTQTKKMILVK
ncbi:MAG TPA: Omp28-related outer membrane protein [Ignavibacteria bacterium]|nr:Omp28-related outer membrane protein [Ignavibacteria bacterium]HRJ03098.1 Omp28-related outer membrane protein [Ignavibacteria bacterium]HRJ85656.1 Omp28-related outer membrane protein [Ignavibacteria bacterium]